MADLRRLRDDLRAFAEACGFPMAEWQADALALDKRTTVLISPRQCGKSTSLAVLALHRAFARPAQVILVVSASDEAAKRPWLTERAEGAEKAATSVPGRAWQFFEDLAGAGGRCGAGEHERYGFNTHQQMGTATTQLVSANLVVRETDPDNGSRHIHSVTPVGWLVYFKRNEFEVPAS